MKKFFTVIGAIVAGLPWISQIKSLNIIPGYWDNGITIINILVSVLTFVLVASIHLFRNNISELPKPKILKLTIVSLFLFAVALISLLQLGERYKSIDSGCCIPIKDGQDCPVDRVFVPLFLPDSIEAYQKEHEIGSISEWIKHDQCHVNEILIEEGGSSIETSFAYTMLLYCFLYLLVFIFLILSIVPIGFYYAAHDKKIII